MTTLIEGQLQIDHERGVIYFHADIEAMQNGSAPTALRICGLGRVTYPFSDRQIDLTISPLSFADGKGGLIEKYEVRMIGVK